MRVRSRAPWAPIGRPTVALVLSQAKAQLRLKAARFRGHYLWLLILVCWPGLFALSIGLANAKPATQEVEGSDSPRVEPPSLLRKVALPYPTEALAEGLHGNVSVLVDVDEQGQVKGARVEDGPDVFHESALEAAGRLEFLAGRRDGSPVAMTTRVWFHFAPPGEDESDEPEVKEKVLVVAHASDPDREDIRTRKTLEEEALDRFAGSDLAETVAQVPGVRLAQGTADAAKPIIRGQRERRLLILYDGVRHESQKWGPDHATEIDPFSAGKITVIRGAAGARYGPDAMGGVVLVDPPTLRSEAGIGGKAIVAFATNGLRPYGALRLDAVPRRLPGLSFRLEGSGSFGASLKTPNYTLGNTASKTWNLGGAVGYQFRGGRIRASWHHHDRKMGVFYGIRNSTPDEFNAQLEMSEPASASLWSTSHAIDRPHQSVAHDVGLLRGDFFGTWGEIEAIYAFQLNRRREFEQSRESVTEPQFDFTLRTHSLDLLYKHPALTLPFGRLSGGLGLQSAFQENVYRGLSLIPSFRSFSGGAFLFQRLSLPRVDVEAGARVDGLGRTSFLRDNDFDAHQRRGTLTPEDCTEDVATASCPARYVAGSISIGALVHAVPDVLDLKLDLSSASRFPNVDELFLLGSSPSFPVFAHGYPSLGVERAWGATMTVGLRLPLLEFEVSAFGQLVDDYIYFSPQRGPDGDPSFEVTIRGTWPSFGYQPINAAFYGVDGGLALWPKGPVGLEVRGAVIRSQDRETAEHLVGTPPDQLALAVVGRPPPLGPLQDAEVRVQAELNDRQRWVDPGADIAPPPPGYVLLGASIETSIALRMPLRIGIEGSNLLNTSYRDYTSLLRYYAEQPGWDLRIRLGASF